MAEPELLPCPFDDGQGLHGMKVRDNGRDGCGPADSWWVQCKCGAEGPNTRGTPEAIAAWNRRSVPGDVREALVEILADIDAVDDGTLPRISSATISRARQAVGEWSPGVAKAMAVFDAGMAERRAREVRAKALEEAAKLCDEVAAEADRAQSSTNPANQPKRYAGLVYQEMAAELLAKRIRALISPPQGSVSSNSGP